MILTYYTNEIKYLPPHFMIFQRDLPSYCLYPSLIQSHYWRRTLCLLVPYYVFPIQSLVVFGCSSLSLLPLWDTMLLEANHWTSHKSYIPQCQTIALRKRINLDQELFCACRGESTGVENGNAFAHLMSRKTTNKNLKNIKWNPIVSLLNFGR